MDLGMKDIEEDDARFINGSLYKGTWDALGMEGIGRYVLPHLGTLEGQFRDGTFHGHGNVYWPSGQRMDGVWYRGECKDKRYVFNDGLIFRESDWEYCKFPDRRYQMCILHGLRPAGATLRTNRQHDIFIPPGCYDAGIGIFDPRTRCIVSYKNPKKMLEIPTATMARWIKEHCRKGWTEPTGHREELYENWFPRAADAPIFPPTLLPFTKDSPECWWKRLSTFERDDMQNTETRNEFSFMEQLASNDIRKKCQDSSRCGVGDE